ncbi:MAG: hypothetical protein IMW93_08420 [Thermoanaerobacteraceae bacterium]|nr:hypothetical protein [Thermoanaerobacteraceae bacterium]
MPRDQAIDEKNLSRKYRTNVGRLVRAWKKGLSDMEIAAGTGIDPLTLQQIRCDIEMAHRRLRLARKKESSGERQIMFRLN